MYNLFLKRIIDLVFSIFGFLILSPFFLIVLISLAILNHGKPFFFQSRPGKNNRTFQIIKFKSMNDKRYMNNVLLKNEERLTRFGKFIRKTSLDELPQLLNVLKGDMSIVGPRPLKIDYLSLYNDFQKRRHEVRPGITGWAQVNGRNSISYSDRFKLDVWYVDNCSFLLDLKIIYMTFLKIFKKDQMDITGVNPNIPFDGTN